MPTSTIGSTGNHANATDWEFATQGDLSGTGETRGEVLEEEITDWVLIAGGTNSDANNFRHLTAQATASIFDKSAVGGFTLDYNPAYASITNAVAYKHTVEVSEAHADVSRLQLENTEAGGGRRHAYIVGGVGSSPRIYDCICKGVDAASISSGPEMSNTLLITTAVAGVGLLVAYGATVINVGIVCLAANNTDNGINNQTAAGVFKNVWIADFGTGASGADWAGSNATTADRIGTVDATGPAADSNPIDLTSLAASVVSATDDFRPSSGGELENAGLAVTGFETDAFGVSRGTGETTACELGPVEVTAAAGGGIEVLRRRIEWAH